MKFTQIAADAFEKLQLNAGVLLTEFDPSVGELDRSKIFGATSGGVAFTATPEYTDFGEDVDNVPANMKEFKVLSSVTATMSGTFLTVDTETAKVLIGAADIDPTTGKVTPRVDLLQTDFADVWWVGDYSNVNTGESAGFIAIKLINALSTGGFQIQSGKDAKGTMSFEFTGHYSLEDITVVPYDLYIQKGSNEEAADATLSALSLGAATLAPEFDADVTTYTASTSSSTNTITATPSDESATVTITLDDEPITGTTITWGSEETQVVKVVVTNGTETKTYTITVTVS